jgi:DNA-binding GntR family transcriptional regulator
VATKGIGNGDCDRCRDDIIGSESQRARRGSENVMDDEILQQSEFAHYIGREAETARAIEEDIIFGRLPPGTRLVEDTLLARFGGTRHLIRQALVQLERTGLVVRERNKSAVVRTLSIDEVNKIYEIRELLHRKAAMLIRLPAKETLIERLSVIQASYERHAAEGNLRGVHEANDLFHLTMFAECGNEYLLEEIRRFMLLSLPVRAGSIADAGMRTISTEHHRLMINMLRGRDNWLLAELCVAHLNPSRQHYLERAGMASPLR